MPILDKNDIKLYYETDIVSNPIGNVIVVHGLCEHLSRYDYFTKKLNENGYNVFRLDLPGHGRTPGKKGDIKSFMQFVEAIKLIIDMAKDLYPKLNLYLFGHSMGGFSINAFLATYPGYVTKAISCGAPGIILKMVKPLKYVPYQLIGFINYSCNLANLTSHSKIEIEKYKSDALVLKKTKIHLLGNVFIKGIKYLQKNISNITDPILYIHGEDDKIVEVESSKWLYENISSKDKKLIIYEGMYHELLSEEIKDTVIKDIINFIKE